MLCGGSKRLLLAMSQNNREKRLFLTDTNYYLSGNHKWKVQVDYTFQREEDLAGVESDESMVRAQVQAYF